MLEALASEAFIQAFAPKTIKLVSGCMPLEVVRGYRVELHAPSTPGNPSRQWELLAMHESPSPTHRGITDTDPERSDLAQDP